MSSNKLYLKSVAIVNISHYKFSGHNYYVCLKIELGDGIYSTISAASKTTTPKPFSVVILINFLNFINGCSIVCLGATVAVECGGDGLKSFRQEVKTNEKGEFEARLPVSIGKHVDRIKNCSVKLVSSSEPYCAVAATATSSEIRFKTKKAGTHVFSAGFFTFKPELCSQKDFAGKGFPPALPDPATPFLPPIGEGILPPLPVPDLPVPPLVPPVPRIPGIPIPPVTRQKPSESNDLADQKIFGFPFPPNPFQPPTLPPVPFVPAPPSLFPPLPFQPSPPSLIPPLIPSPPPASLFPPLMPFPPLPGVIPSPPPPPPPAFPIPLPPLPPVPGIPIPPASNRPHLGKTTP